MDGFFGALLAVEGIRDARAVINGPGGCRGYPAYLSDRLFPREHSLNHRYFEELFFFGQSRIPCTSLDADDYVAGSSSKLAEILPLIAEKGDTVIAIINSPGAALIGDDITRLIVQAGLSQRCMACACSGYSHPVYEGFDETVVSVLSWLRLNRLVRVKRRVNLLGLCLSQRYWEGNIAELIKLCNLMGLEVVSHWSGSSVANIRESPTASHNLVIFPEYARSTAAWYEREFGIPAIISPMGAPVGFFATGVWIRTVASALHVDPAPALAYLQDQRDRAFQVIGRHSHEAAFLKGVTFGIRAEVSWALPLVCWLYTYLGMLPVTISLLPGGDPDQIHRLVSFLEDHGLTHILDADPIRVTPEFFFATGIGGRDLVASGVSRWYLDLSNRMYADCEFTQKGLLGGVGSLLLLEQVFQQSRNLLYRD